MNQYLLRSRRILAIVLLAMFALLQVNVVFASCNTLDTEISLAMAEMDSCPGCQTDAANSSGSIYGAVSPICSDTYKSNFVFSGNHSVQPTAAFTTVALAIATAPPPVFPHVQPSPPGKISLIYRFQRLLI